MITAQTLQFSEWLKGSTVYSDQALSPIYLDFRDAAPLYLQAGGKEMQVEGDQHFPTTQRTEITSF